MGNDVDYEAVLRRSASQNRPGRPRWGAQIHSRSPLRREPLLCQAVPQDRRAGSAAGAKEGGWKTAKDRPDRGETPPRGRRGAPRRYRVRKASLLGRHHGQDPERLYRKAAAQEARLQPKKRTMGAVERDEWLRAAWKLIVTREITI